MSKTELPSLDGLKGQDRAVGFLKRIMAGDLGGRVYLFTGPPGAGKRTAARALAAARLCQGRRTAAEEPGFGFGKPEPAERPAPAVPCGSCPACLKLIAGSHQDLVIVEPEADKKQVSVEQARELMKSLQFAPQEADLRFVLFPQAERLSLAAANALLKTLEEPPGHTVIILTAAEAEALPQTILSRCQRLAFQPLEREVIAQEVAARKGLDDEAARLAAGLSGGSMGLALALDPAEALARRDQALARLGGLRRGNVGALFELAQAVAAKPEETAEFIKALAAWYRDLMVLAAGSDPEAVINRDRLAELTERAVRVPAETWAERLKAVLSAEAALEANANVRLTMEAMLLRLAPGMIGEGR